MKFATFIVNGREGSRKKPFRVSKRDLLDGDKYPWLHGYSLAFILVASYDHHQEHHEKLTAWMQRQGAD